MAYLTFCEYTELGGTVTESAFPLLERKARRKLDYFTQNRLTEIELEDQTDAVKEVMTEFIETISSDISSNVTSYSNGIESMSYDTSSSTDDILLQVAVEILPVETISGVVITAQDLCEVEDDT